MTLTEFELKKYELIHTEESKRKKEGYLKALEIIERKAREQLQTTNCWIKVTAENILEVLEVIPEPLERLIATYHLIEEKNGSFGLELQEFCRTIGFNIIDSEATLCSYCQQQIFRSQPYEKFGNVRYHLNCYQDFLSENKDYQVFKEQHQLKNSEGAAE